MSCDPQSATLAWLLDSDPSIRWQVMRDLTKPAPDAIGMERARVATEGWGARLLALQGEDGQWAGGACFPARSFNWREENQGQPWTATLPTLTTLGVQTIFVVNPDETSSNSLNLTVVAAPSLSSLSPNSADAANPQAPSAITRTLMPTDSASDALPTLPFFVESARLRIATTRVSA